MSSSSSPPSPVASQASRRSNRLHESAAPAAAKGRPATTKKDGGSRRKPSGAGQKMRDEEDTRRSRSAAPDPPPAAAGPTAASPGGAPETSKSAKKKAGKAARAAARALPQAGVTADAATADEDDARAAARRESSAALAAQQLQIELLTRLVMGQGQREVKKDRPELPKGAFHHGYDGSITPASGASASAAGSSLSLDAWISQARLTKPLYPGMPEDHAVLWLAASLRGTAMEWYEGLVNDKATPATSDALFQLLRDRFQPIATKETAMRELATLKQDKLSVDAYANRFNSLHSKLPSKLPEEFVVFQFRNGLRRELDHMITQGAAQPTTLRDIIQLAARLEGRNASSGSDRVSNAETDGREEQLLARIAALEHQARAATSKPAYESRYNKGSNKGKPGRVHSGLPDEVWLKRKAANLCFHCGLSADHTVRDCPAKARGEAQRTN